MNGSGTVFEGRVLSLRDVQELGDGRADLAVGERTLITPLAADELRARGIRVLRAAGYECSQKLGKEAWSIALEQSNPAAAGAIGALRREGLVFDDWGVAGALGAERWYQTLARKLGKNGHGGCVVFCRNANLACCIANKVAGVRAAAVGSVAQARRAREGLGANLLAVEVPGWTFFEVRQLLRSVHDSEGRLCPASVSEVLAELETDAHR